MTARGPRRWAVLSDDADGTADGKPLNPIMEQIRQVLPFAFEEPDGLTCGQCVNRSAKDGKSWCQLGRWFIEDHQPVCDFFDLRADET